MEGIEKSNPKMVLISDGEKLIEVPANTIEPKATDEYVQIIVDQINNISDWILYLNNNLAMLGAEITSIKKQLNKDKEE